MKELLTHWAVGLFLAFHAVAHFAGVVSDLRWSRRVGDGDVQLLGGSLSLSRVTLQLMAGLWACLACGFAVSAVAFISQLDWAMPLVLAVSLTSLALSAVHWPDARIGIAINACIVVLSAASLFGVSFPLD